MIPLSGLTAIPRASEKTLSAEDIKRKAREEMDSEQVYYSLVAIPLCMGAVAWDFIDTVLDMCVILRIDPLKKVCRAIRQIHTDYSYQCRKLVLSSDQMKPLHAWVQNFLDSTNGSTDMSAQIKDELLSRYPGLHSDWYAMLSSAYLAIVYLKGIIKYTEAEERSFAEKIGVSRYGHMLPDEIYKAVPLLDAVAGDCTLDDEFLRPFICEVVDMMTDVGQSATEPPERTEYRHRCIAFVCNGGCRAQAVNGSEYGCFPASVCRRMMRYDKKHK